MFPNPHELGLKQSLRLRKDEKVEISLKSLNEWLPVIVRYTFQLGGLRGEI